MNCITIPQRPQSTARIEPFISSTYQMNIYLWNLSINDTEIRLWLEEWVIQSFVESSWLVHVQKTSEISSTKWWFHVFDMPFHFKCDSKETAMKFYEYLSDKEIKWTVWFSY